MLKLRKKIVVDESGAPQEVIISWKQFCEIAEALGFDLDEKVRNDLRIARHDFRHGKSQAFLPLISQVKGPKPTERLGLPLAIIPLFD